MINLLLFFVFLTCAGITAAWIAENPGVITIHWFGYRIDTSFAFMLLMVAIAAIVLAYFYILIRRIILAPDYVSSRGRVKRYEKGLAELTYSVAALASADPKEAEKHTRKAEKLLGKTPLTLLLSAQIARSQGNDEKTQTLLTQMLDFKETEYLAARSLSESAGKNQQLTTALSLAQRAHALNPSGIAQVLSLHLRLAQWQQAIASIDKAMRKNQITRAQMRHYKSMVYIQQGEQLLENGQAPAALNTARLALKFAPEYSPAITFAGKTHIENGQPDKALKLLLNAWKRNADPSLSESIKSAILALPKEKQMKWAQKFRNIQPHALESDVLFAQIAMAHYDWKTARKVLNSAISKSETALICKLMAELEQQERSDFEEAGHWMNRSSVAQSNAAWTCNTCGTIASKWHPHCPECTAFDALEWKSRDLKFV